MSENKIKVMVVDDSVLMRKYLSKIINNIDRLEVIATAPDGKIALKKIFLLKPDLITLDIEMPVMNGLELLSYLKEHVPEDQRPLVIVLSSLVGDRSFSTFEALEKGASDFIKKPEGKITENLENLSKELQLKITSLFEHKKESKSIPPVSFTTTEPSKLELMKKYKTLEGIRHVSLIKNKKKIQPQIIAIGSSTGGPNAIRKILDKLMTPLPVPMVIAQHMPEKFTNEFAKNLSRIYQRPVKEASEGDLLQPGVIYICPGGVHSRIERKKENLIFHIDPKEYEGFFFKPSVDIFFESIRKSCGKQVLAIILSGMGKDGSIESLRLRKEGSIVFAQNKKSSVVWGMPGSSFKRGGVDLILDIEEIGEAINRIFTPKKIN